MGEIDNRWEAQMYIPEAFREKDVVKLVDFMRCHSFGTLITPVEGRLQTTHIPFVVRPGPPLTLLGHVARNNPHWEALERGHTSTVLFQGPHAYVSPTWYAKFPAVPTWNYMVVHAHGPTKLLGDRPAMDLMLSELVERHEPPVAVPWKPEQLPLDVHDQLVAAIVGFELCVAELEGQFKLGQNRSRADRLGVIENLRKQGSSDTRAIAAAMTAMVDRDEADA